MGPTLRTLDSKTGVLRTTGTKELYNLMQSMQGFLAKMVFKKLSLVGALIWSMHFLFARVIITPY